MRVWPEQKCWNIKKKTYVRAARVSGMSGLEILLYTILPNSLSPLIVAASMHVGNAIIELLRPFLSGTGQSASLSGMGNNAE